MLAAMRADPTLAARKGVRLTPACGGAFAPSDGNRDRARPHSQRECQRVECVPEGIRRVNLPAGLYALLLVWALQHRPARRDDDGPSADLHDRERNPEEREDVRPDQVRPDQQEEAVHGDPLRQRLARLRRVLVRQREEDGASSERIHDREQRADDEEDALRRFNHGISAIPYRSRPPRTGSTHKRVQASLKSRRGPRGKSFDRSTWPRLHRKLDFTCPAGKNSCSQPSHSWPAPKNSSSTFALSNPDIGPQSRPKARAAIIR